MILIKVKSARRRPVASRHQCWQHQQHTGHPINRQRFSRVDNCERSCCRYCCCCCCCGGGGAGGGAGGAGGAGAGVNSTSGCVTLTNQPNVNDINSYQLPHQSKDTNNNNNNNNNNQQTSSRSSRRRINLTRRRGRPTTCSMMLVIWVAIMAASHLVHSQKLDQNQPHQQQQTPTTTNTRGSSIISLPHDQDARGALARIPNFNRDKEDNNNHHKHQSPPPPLEQTNTDLAARQLTPTHSLPSRSASSAGGELRRFRRSSEQQVLPAPSPPPPVGQCRNMAAFWRALASSYPALARHLLRRLELGANAELSLVGALGAEGRGFVRSATPTARTIGRLLEQADRLAQAEPRHWLHRSTGASWLAKLAAHPSYGMLVRYLEQQMGVKNNQNNHNNQNNQNNQNRITGGLAPLATDSVSISDDQQLGKLARFPHELARAPSVGAETLRKLHQLARENNNQRGGGVPTETGNELDGPTFGRVAQAPSQLELGNSQERHHHNHQVGAFRVGVASDHQHPPPTAAYGQVLVAPQLVESAGAGADGLATGSGSLSRLRNRLEPAMEAGEGGGVGELQQSTHGGGLANELAVQLAADSVAVQPDGGGSAASSGGGGPDAGESSLDELGTWHSGPLDKVQVEFLGSVAGEQMVQSEEQLQQQQQQQQRQPLTQHVFAASAGNDDDDDGIGRRTNSGPKLTAPKAHQFAGD